MLHKLLGQVEDLLPLTIFAFLFGFIKATVSPTPWSLKNTLLTILVSVPVGTLAGAVGLELGFGQYVAFTITSVSSLLAHDIVLGILNNKTLFSDLFKRAAENLIDKTTK
jgi:hypothetical protein